VFIELVVKAAKQSNQQRNSHMHNNNNNYSFVLRKQLKIYHNSALHLSIRK